MSNLQASRRRALCRVAVSGAVASAVAFGLAGCGGDETAAPPPVTMSGILIDGPIRGATVFLDLNRNFQHDNGEPISMPTAADGAFTIVAERLTQAQAATAMFVSKVPDTAFDADDLGQSIAQAARNGFTLAAPVSASVTVDAAGNNAVRSAVVSPLTTLVAAEMAFNGLTLAQSKVAAQTVLPTPSRDVMSNFVADRDVELGVVARTAAIALGDAGKAISDFAKTQPGGVEMREQVAATIAAMKEQLPSLLLGLAPFTQLPSVTAVRSELANPAAADALTKAMEKIRRP
jgi:hypothetical protein